MVKLKMIDRVKLKKLLYFIALTVILFYCYTFTQSNWAGFGFTHVKVKDLNIETLLHPKLIPTNYRPRTITFNTSSLSIPSVYVIPVGGFGNQLFQYACGYALARKLRVPFYIQAPANWSSGVTYGRQYGLDSFHLNASIIQYGNYQDPPFPPNNLIFKLNELALFGSNSEPEPLPNDKILYFKDFCESEIFFKPFTNEIRKQFQLSLNLSVSGTSFAHQMLNSESVAVHVRRGDFQVQNDPANRLLPISYYVRSMQLIQSKLTAPTFFLFSDDMNYAKSQLGHLFNVTVVQLGYLEEFYLMANHCKHLVIPNSTFSWWAAYLNKNVNKMIIAPFPRYSKKFYTATYNSKVREYKEWLYRKYSYPEGWWTLNPFESFEETVGS